MEAIREALANAVHAAFVQGRWPSECPIVQRLERLLAAQ
jgi:hypothetical protein